MSKVDINMRFKDAPWYKQCLAENILVGGAGGISSNTLYYLCKTIPCTYWIFDYDIVEEHNVGTQFFHIDQIGQSKVTAIVNTLCKFTTATFRTFNKKFEIGEGCQPIAIAGFDNMQARKDLFEEWKKLPNKELYIDGRLRANLYEVYVVTPDRIEEYEKTLFEDSEVDEGECTFKQTAYFAGLIGARIAHVVVNYLTNKYAETPYCNLPFKIEEIGDPFFINLTEYNENTKSNSE
jgi:molybdopterin/thiamine biosynthesis adenylyltransferase